MLAQNARDGAGESDTNLTPNVRHSSLDDE
jgi:hypothetical protein